MSLLITIWKNNFMFKVEMTFKYDCTGSFGREKLKSGFVWFYTTHRRLLTKAFEKVFIKGIWLVHKSSFICETPGYHHMSAASNAVTRDYFSHDPTIWSKYIPYFIYKIWTSHRIQKWKPASCRWENFWFNRTKKFFLF